MIFSKWFSQLSFSSSTSCLAIVSLPSIVFIVHCSSEWCWPWLWFRSQEKEEEEGSNRARDFRPCSCRRRCSCCRCPREQRCMSTLFNIFFNFARAPWGLLDIQAFWREIMNITTRRIWKEAKPHASSWTVRGVAYRCVLSGIVKESLGVDGTWSCLEMSDQPPVFFFRCSVLGCWLWGLGDVRRPEEEEEEEGSWFLAFIGTLFFLF